MLDKESPKVYFYRQKNNFSLSSSTYSPEILVVRFYLYKWASFDSYLYPIKGASYITWINLIQLMMELTPQSVQKMLRNEAATNQLLIVEGKRIGKSKGTFLSLLISDG